MIPTRIIARLDVKGPDVVKGIQFEGVRRVGSPQELARKYYAEGADEILFIDSVASLYGRNNILSIVEKTACEIFVPLTVGGGLRSIDDIRAALRAGADKVAINTGACQNPEILRQAANTFGSQSIVLSVQAMKRTDGTWEAYTDNARERTHRNVLDWVVEAEALGAGEILITSVNNEGTRKGFDLDLTEAVYNKVKVPVIACGGAGNAQHVDALLAKRCADAVTCASIFHFGLCPIPQLKTYLHEHGQTVRQVSLHPVPVRASRPIGG